MKVLQRREVELQEEIDRIKLEKVQESQQRGIKNLVERSKSRGRDPGMANTVSGPANEGAKGSLGFSQVNKKQL